MTAKEIFHLLITLFGLGIIYLLCSIIGSTFNAFEWPLWNKITLTVLSLIHLANR